MWAEENKVIDYIVNVGRGINFGEEASLRACYLKGELNIEKEIPILEEENSRQIELQPPRSWKKHKMADLAAAQ